MTYALRLTEAQHRALVGHLFPGDGKEAVALLLCGRRRGQDRHVFTVRKVLPIPHDVCYRTWDRITWPTDHLEGLLRETYGSAQALVKVHSHTAGFSRFSS